MKVLFYDIIQLSNAPKPLCSPALADKWIGNNLIIDLDQPREITCVGIGYTDAHEINLTFRPAELITIEGNTDTPQYIYDGGSGFVAGSTNSLRNGGGYGKPGGGAENILGGGGGSKTLRPSGTREDTSLEGGRHLYNAYQGGGAGSRVGSGGSGLTTSMSSRVIIYRVG